MPALKYSFLISIILNLFFHQSTYSQCAEADIINLKKIAIVFGEKDYKYCSPLMNTLNDANDISDSLTKVGFTVYNYQNTDYKTMTNDFDRWSAIINKYDVALFYFSGHGIEVKGENYLLPTDVHPSGPSDLAYTAFSANKMLERLDNSNLKYSIVILDACRNNPFTKSWSRDFAKGGLATMSSKGSFIAFAAAAGATASDGKRRNGTYTEGILKFITKPNLTIDQIFTKVNSYVRSSTNGDQTPFKNSSLGSDYCFSVTRTIRTVGNVTIRPFSFLQPTSAMLMSQNKEYIFTADSASGGLSVRDAKTLNIISFIMKGSGKPALISSRNNGNLYVADSIHHFVNIVNWKESKVVQTVKLNYLPLAIVPSSDDKLLFICGNYQGSGVVSIIDLLLYKEIKELKLKNEIAKMVMSTDGKRIFISSKYPANVLFIGDVKSPKIIKEIVDLPGEVIGITPNDKKLYISEPSKNNKISIIDLNTYKKIATIDANASSFAFTDNSKYVFASNDNQIAVLRDLDGLLIKELPFVTPPDGIALSNDGNGFVWLPKEKRAFTFILNDVTKVDSNSIDPELKFKKFKEEINSDPSLAERIKQRKLFSKINGFSQGFSDYISSVVSEIVNGELNINYRMTNDFPQTDCYQMTANFSYGIFLIADKKKSINAKFNIQYQNDAVIITVKDGKIDKVTDTLKFSLSESDNSDPRKPNFVPSYMRIPINEIDKKTLGKLIRNFFIKRSDYLK